MDAKKILIAVDGSENSLRAVSYTAEMMRDTRDLSVMLLCIERFPERDLFPDEAAWKQHCSERREEMHAFLAQARALLEQQGLPPEVISERYLTSCASPFSDGDAEQCSMGMSIALEIIAVLKGEGYGTVVVGRRGVSKAEEFLFGSVSSKIIHHAKDCTVWVVA